MVVVSLFKEDKDMKMVEFTYGNEVYKFKISNVVNNFYTDAELNRMESILDKFMEHWDWIDSANKERYFEDYGRLRGINSHEVNEEEMYTKYYFDYFDYYVDWSIFSMTAYKFFKEAEHTYDMMNISIVFHVQSRMVDDYCNINLYNLMDDCLRRLGYSESDKEDRERYKRIYKKALKAYNIVRDKVIEVDSTHKDREKERKENQFFGSVKDSMVEDGDTGNNLLIG